MNRRDFLKKFGKTAAGAAALGVAVKAGTLIEDSRHDSREKAHYSGDWWGITT